MKTWLDRYPTGRKHCTSCKRWRHGIDFNARTWADEPYCTMPSVLNSICRPCLTERARVRNGSKPRVWYSHGSPDSEQYRQWRRERSRITRRRRLRSKQRRAKLNEYARIWYNAKKAEAPPRVPKPHKPSPPQYSTWDTEVLKDLLRKLYENRVACSERSRVTRISLINKELKRRDQREQ